jgi:hypothetical protein
MGRRVEGPVYVCVSLPLHRGRVPLSVKLVHVSYNWSAGWSVTYHISCGCCVCLFAFVCMCRVATCASGHATTLCWHVALLDLPHNKASG